MPKRMATPAVFAFRHMRCERIKGRIYLCFALVLPGVLLSRWFMSVLAIDVGNSRVGLKVFTAGRTQEPSIRLHHTNSTMTAGDARDLWKGRGRNPPSWATMRTRWW